MKFIVKLFLLLALGVLCRARHIHPNDRVQEEIIFEDLNNVAELDAPIDVLNLKPTRFVPINSIFFFKIYEPCEDGFERDALGICREVW